MDYKKELIEINGIIIETLAEARSYKRTEYYQEAKEFAIESSNELMSDFKIIFKEAVKVENNKEQNFNEWLFNMVQYKNILSKNTEILDILKNF